MKRRDFLAMVPTAGMGAAGLPFIKSICGVIFPESMPLAQQFREAKSAGFEGIELRLGAAFPVDTPKDEAARVGDLARKAGIAIASLWVSEPLRDNPLNHSDASLRAKGVDALHQAIELAKIVGCGALLVVPGRVGDGAKFTFGYQDTWDRVSLEMRKLIPHATEARVFLTLENVWNKFLLSPMEMRNFVDQFESPWLQSHFDVGNVMQTGYPQDWIQTLGKRIQRVHVKDYKLSRRAEQGRFVELLEGDVDWKEVMAALRKTGYRGFLSPEMGAKPEDPGYLMKVSRALDHFLALA